MKKKKAGAKKKPAPKKKAATKKKAARKKAVPKKKAAPKKKAIPPVTKKDFRKNTDCDCRQSASGEWFRYIRMGGKKKRMPPGFISEEECLANCGD